MKIRGYDVEEYRENNIYSYIITKEDKIIATLQGVHKNCYNLFIKNADGILNYNNPSYKNIIVFLAQVIKDIEDYYERRKSFI